MLTSHPHGCEEARLAHEEPCHMHKMDAIEVGLLTSHLTIVRELPWLVRSPANTQKCFQQHGFYALNMYPLATTLVTNIMFNYNTCNQSSSTFATLANTYMFNHHQNHHHICNTYKYELHNYNTCNYQHI